VTFSTCIRDLSCTNFGQVSNCPGGLRIAG
jgi:hypothetical protein